MGVVLVIAALYLTRGEASAEELLPQKLVDDLRVGLALRLLHHLADEEAEQPSLPPRYVAT